MKGDIIHSHQIQSVGCWIPCALCLGGRSCEWCGASCCCRPSSSLCLGPHRGLCWRVLGNPPRSDGAGRRSGVAPCKAAPSPIDHDKDTHKCVDMTQCACDSNIQPLSGSRERVAVNKRVDGRDLLKIDVKVPPRGLELLNSNVSVITLLQHLGNYISPDKLKL